MFKNPILVGSFVLFGLVSLSFFIFSHSLNQTDTVESEGFLNLFLGPSQKFSLESPNFLLIENCSLKASLPPVMVTPQVLAQVVGQEDIRNEITTHIVEAGESLWSIAKKYDLKIETVIWANGIKDSIIQPGQELTILPVDGLIHLVEKGDTLESIAAKYKADSGKIVAINEIFSPDEIFENQALIVPDGKLPSTSQIEKQSFTNLSTNNFYGLSHKYPYGYCTWWVAQQRAIPSWGNAKDWLSNAAVSGFPVCRGRYCTPQVGAVISLNEGRLGHVAYVERITENKVIFSEMNYIGWGKMDWRSLRFGDYRILGYIYKSY
jgi:surface antigen